MVGVGSFAPEPTKHHISRSILCPIQPTQKVKEQRPTPHPLNGYSVNPATKIHGSLVIWQSRLITTCGNARGQEELLPNPTELEPPDTTLRRGKIKPQMQQLTA